VDLNTWTAKRFCDRLSFQPLPTQSIGKLYQFYGPERASAVVKGLLDFSNADITSAKAGKADIAEEYATYGIK